MRQFRPRTPAELEAEKAESRELYARLRGIVTSETLPDILQDPDNETGAYLARRFESRDPAKVKADCISLLDKLEAAL